MLNKKQVISLLSIPLAVIVVYVCFGSLVNLGRNTLRSATNIDPSGDPFRRPLNNNTGRAAHEFPSPNRDPSTEQNDSSRGPPTSIVLGKELQSVKKYVTDDVLISVRTTSVYHKNRLSLLFLTWMQSLSTDQVGQ